MKIEYRMKKNKENKIYKTKNTNQLKTNNNISNTTFILYITTFRTTITYTTFQLYIYIYAYTPFL